MADANSISAEEARKFLDYNQETGEFSWRLTRSSRARAGATLGSWDMHGYKTVRILGRSYKLHRLAYLIMTGSWPSGDIDHLNGIRHDNRWANLRDVPRVVNLQNRRAGVGRTGLLGAYFDPRKNCYYSRISMGDKSVHLGTFSSAQAAHEAYVEAKRRMHAGCTL